MAEVSDDSHRGALESLVALCTALRFLTVVPVRWRQEEDGAHFKQSVGWFPLVGVGIGLCGALLALLLQAVAPPMVAATVLLLYLAAVSNALHLDGLSDSADGLYSARSRERTLEIMKDSRIGSMGAVSIFFVLLGKFAALSSLPAGHLPTALFFMPFAGRCTLLFAMATMPCARKGEGIGVLFYGGEVQRRAVFALIVLALALLAGFKAGGVVVLCAVLAGFYLLRRKAMAVLGGATGDILGAQCEVAELMCAVGISLIF